MRKIITVAAAIAITLAATGCATDDPSPSLGPAPQPSPEQQYLDALERAGFDFNDPAKTVRFGETICQLYRDGHSEANVVKITGAIVAQGRSSIGREKEAIRIARKYLCPDL